MKNPLSKPYGIRDPTSTNILRKEPPPSLPQDHPCNGCVILDMSSGVPYCFLPRCDRGALELFESKGCGSDA